MHETFTLYDLETTGRNVRYDSPVQFAAIRVDGDLRVLSDINLRARPSKFVLPAPGALVVNGLGLSQLLNERMSFYKLMCKVETFLSSGAPTCHMAFNGIRFDEEVLRHSLYRALHAPYLTQFDGNCRGDAMRLIQAAHALEPGALSVPIARNGRPVFKQDLLAKANGIVGYRAHDAMEDVLAMRELLRLLHQNAPTVWRMLSLWTNKPALLELMESHPVVLSVSYSAGKSLSPVCPNPSYETEWALVDLRIDPTEYINCSAKVLCETLKPGSRFRPLVKVKANAMPIVLPGDHPLAQRLHSVDEETRKARANFVRANSDFVNRVGEAMRLSREGFGQPEHVEERLYCDGFFPRDSDQLLLAQFHAAEADKKLAILHQVKDQRARELGMRLVLEEWPEILPNGNREQLENPLFGRLTTDAVVPWMTVKKALEEIEELRFKGHDDAVLGEYEEYLRRIPRSLIAA